MTVEQQAIKRTWWKEAVVYQIYPKSFKDSNGDGIGDLRGIFSELDYIKSLEVDVVWLNPIFASPNDDNGYDISDYRNILPEFGTMDDFDALLKGLHQRGIKLLLDLVVNHSSDEHFWFRESRKSRDNPYRNYYHWWPAEKGKPAARWSFFDINADAWAYDEQTDSYYLHYFSRKQPDLNWENPALRKEIYDIMNFWFEKGVDGFRMDVIPFISKDTGFPPLPDHYHGDYVAYYASGPRLHEYLQEMNRETLSKYEVMSVGEGVGVTLHQAHDFVDEDRNELNMFFHFEGMNLGFGEYKRPLPEGWKLSDFKKIYSKWSDVFNHTGWGSIYLGNHDQPRMVSRWGNDEDEHRFKASKMLLTFLLTMRATPYIYSGDELGMKNIRFDSIADYDDIEVKNWYALLKNSGRDTRPYIEGWKLTGRDNSRTPFQWSSGPNAGFTNAKPWLAVNPDYVSVNKKAQESDGRSVLGYFKKIMHIRKSHAVFTYGNYRLLCPDDESLYVYERYDEASCFVIIFNFSTGKIPVGRVGFALTDLQFIIGNHEKPDKDFILPYDCRVYKK